jgi:hypothetical protein
MGDKWRRSASLMYPSSPCDEPMLEYAEGCARASEIPRSADWNMLNGFGTSDVYSSRPPLIPPRIYSCKPHSPPSHKLLSLPPISISIPASPTPPILPIKLLQIPRNYILIPSNPKLSLNPLIPLSHQIRLFRRKVLRPSWLKHAAVKLKRHDFQRSKPSRPLFQHLCRRKRGQLLNVRGGVYFPGYRVPSAQSACTLLESLRQDGWNARASRS